MKYIRTEENEIGIIFKDLIEENTYHIQTKEKTTTILCDKEENLKYLGKISDTIEELCDEFVCNNEIYKRIEHRKMYEGDICVLVDYGGFCVNIQKGNQVYGAIWTDKGLIYVAKMNEKGELELL